MSRRDGDIAMAIFASYVIGQFMPRMETNCHGCHPFHFVEVEVEMTLG